MHSAQLLKKLAQHKRLPHASLFSGNGEVEKEKATEELLGILRVHSADCTRLVPGMGESSSEITIAQIRILTAFLSMSPWSSSWKAAVILQAHTMNQTAQSAFLKFLEEPRDRTLIFLLTPYPDMLLDTVRSRTQEFPFYSFARLSPPASDVAEFQTLRRADLITRFAEVQKLAENPEALPLILHKWLLVARHLLYKAVQSDVENALQLAAILRIMQETRYILQTTNVNPRLALEHLVLQI